MLPEDCIAATEFNDKAECRTVLVSDIPDGWMGLDIGPATAEKFESLLHGARSVFWNGPMGVFELPSFAEGTNRVGMAVAEATRQGASSVVGGGDSVAAVNQMGLAGKMSHISTGGGASLEFMAGMTLPGVDALANAT